MESYNASCYTICMIPQYVPLSNAAVAAEHIVSHNKQESGIVSASAKLLYPIFRSPLT